jgi:diguanylate cyclase (GGDEF)-like protein
VSFFHQEETGAQAFGHYHPDDPSDRAELARQIADLEFAMTWACVDHAATLERMEALAKASGWDDLVARARLLRAHLHRRLGNLPEAIEMAGAVHAWAIDHGHNLLASRTHCALSMIFRHVGDRAGSMEHAVQALALTGPDAPTWVRVNHLLWMGASVASGATVHEAQLYFDEALALAEGIDDVDLRINVLNNVAYSMYEIDDLANATRYADQLDELIVGRSAEDCASHLDTIARIALEHGDHDRVERLLVPVLHTDDTAMAAEADAVPACLLTLAESRRKRGDLTQAQQALSRCRYLVDRRGLLEISTEVRREQAALHADGGMYRDAYTELARAIEETVTLQDAAREFRAHVAHANFEFAETRKSRDEFRDMAWRDALTGLHNRRHLDVELPRHVRLCVAERKPISVAILDLDHFKRVNDTMSHKVGDDVLCQAAEVMLGCAPEGVGVIRLGGEEFVILMPGADHPTALAHCDMIRRALEHHPWTSSAGVLSVTASIGVTTTNSALSSSALLANADRNLYAAKRSGRNRVVGDPS